MPVEGQSTFPPKSAACPAIEKVTAEASAQEEAHYHVGGRVGRTPSAHTHTRSISPAWHQHSQSIHILIFEATGFGKFAGF